MFGCANSIDCMLSVYTGVGFADEKWLRFTTHRRIGCHVSCRRLPKSQILIRTALRATLKRSFYVSFCLPSADAIKWSIGLAQQTSLYSIGPRSDVGQGQSQEKWRAESGGQTLGKVRRRAMADGGRWTERSLYFVLVPPYQNWHFFRTLQSI